LPLLIASARVAIIGIVSAIAVIRIAETQTKPKSRAPKSTTTETSAAEAAAATTSTTAAASKGRCGRSAQQESRRAKDTEAIDTEQSDDCQAAR
jgi:hypothetical protein